MVADIEVYRSAQVLIREHGEDADLEAAIRADAMLAKGDLEGPAVWKHILAAIEQIRRTEQLDGETIH